MRLAMVDTADAIAPRSEGRLHIAGRAASFL
jgi:hypothetical protein